MTDSLSSNLSTARRLLLTPEDVVAALGPGVTIDDSAHQLDATGEMLRAAARDSAYQSFGGQISGGTEPQAFRVAVLVLVFEAEVQAAVTFDHVAEATHLRTEIEGCKVAVETVSGVAGTTSYWGYLYRDRTIVVLTLDTNTPQRLTIADLRSLVQAEVHRLLETGAS